MPSLAAAARLSLVLLSPVFHAFSRACPDVLSGKRMPVPRLAPRALPMCLAYVPTNPKRYTLLRALRAGREYVCMYVCVYVCMYVCMYVCVCVCMRARRALCTRPGARATCRSMPTVLRSPARRPCRPPPFLLPPPSLPHPYSRPPPKPAANGLLPGVARVRAGAHCQGCRAWRRGQGQEEKGAREAQKGQASGGRRRGGSGGAVRRAAPARNAAGGLRI